MAIGDIGVGKVRRANSNSAAGATPESFGAGVGRAIKGFAAAYARKEDAEFDLTLATEQRQQRMEGFETDRRFMGWKREQVQLQDERFRNAPETGVGLTNQTEAEMKASRDAFLETVPPALRERYAVKLEEFTQSTILGAFTMEQKIGDQHFKTQLEQTTNQFATDIYAGNATYEESLAELDELINVSDISAVEKESMRINARAFLQSAEFKMDAKTRLEAGMVRGTLHPRQQAFLDAVAKPESGGAYNIRYAGHGKQGATFDDYSRHPRVYVRTPDGKLSSAAGRYQIVYSTWVRAKAALNLPDFSPNSQDRAALWIAEQDYNKRNPTGAPFMQAIQSDDPAVLLNVKESLKKTWAGFHGFKAQDFLDIITGKTTVPLEGDTRGTVPDIYSDPRYADISFNEKMQLFNSAQSAYTAEQAARGKAAAEEQTAALQQLYRVAQGGGVGEDQIASLWENGTLTKFSQEEKLRGIIDDYNEGKRVEAEVSTVMATGEGVLTKDQHQDALNNLYAQDAQAAFSEKDQDYLTNSFYPMVETTGFIPSEIASSLGQMARGADPKARAYAFEALAHIDEQNPYALRNSDGLDSGIAKDVDFYRAWRKFTPASNVDQLFEALDLRNDPNASAIFDRREKEADKILADNYPLGNLPDKIFDTIVGWEPNLPVTPGQQMALQSNFSELYKQGYSMFGDDAMAFAFSKEQVLKEWGVSDLGGVKRIVRHGVEKFYPRPDLVDRQVREELARRGVSPDATYTLIASPNAKAEGEAWATNPTKAGHNASYVIAVTGEDGITSMIRPDDGDYWSFDGGVDEAGRAHQLPEEQEQSIQDNARIISLEERVRRARDKVFELSDGQHEEELQSLSEELKADVTELEALRSDVYQDEIKSKLDLHLIGLDFKKDPLDKLSVAIARANSETLAGFYTHPAYREQAEIYMRRLREEQ